MSRQDAENGIRSLKEGSTIAEIKEVLLEVLELTMDDTEDYATAKEFELAEERIGNIETCLDEDNDKIDSSRLNL